MAIEGTKKLGDWGKMIPVSNNQHVTQTNINSYDGLSFHNTLNISETPFKVHDRFDKNGNFLSSDFSKR